MKRRFDKSIAAILTAALIVIGISPYVNAAEISTELPLEEAVYDELLSEDHTEDELCDADEPAGKPQAFEEPADVLPSDGADTDITVNDDLTGKDGEQGDSVSDTEVWDGNIPDEYLNYRDIDLEAEESKNAAVSKRGAYPVKYTTSADMLPPVKEQRPFGTCWSFSAIAACEGSLISQGISDASHIDLAERALCYFFYELKGVDDPLLNTYGDYNESRCDAQEIRNIYQLGGNSVAASFFLENWAGTVSEDRAPYQALIDMGDSASLTNDHRKGIDALEPSLCYDPVYHVQNTRFIPISQKDGIKKAVIDNGIVSVSYYHKNGNTYYNAGRYAYNSGGNYYKRTNHAVNIVGWDDDFSREYFNSSCRPDNNGAWLIRNSWGSSFGDGGYMWISYEDKSLSEVRVIVAGQPDEYDNNYFYDGTSGSGFSGNSSSSEWSAANVFTAGSSETLKAVSIAMYSSDVNYSVQIYKNLSDNSVPDSGTPMLAAPVTGVTGYMGYYTIPLNEDVNLESGDTFSVVFTLQKNGGAIAFAEKAINLGWVEYKPQLTKGQSFSCFDGTNWIDNAASSEPCCIRIHAFTKEDNELTPHKAEPVSMETYKDALVGSYTEQMRAAVNKLSEGFGAHWSFEEPDRLLKADNNLPIRKISVISDNGITKDYVKMAVTDIEFKPLAELPDVVYLKGDPTLLDYQASYIGSPLGDSLRTVYSSSDPSVLKISERYGKTYAEAVKDGEATITARLYKGSTVMDAYFAPVSKKVMVIEKGREGADTIALSKPSFTFNYALDKDLRSDTVCLYNGYYRNINSISLVTKKKGEYIPLDKQEFEVSYGKEAAASYVTVKVQYKGPEQKRTVKAYLKLEINGIKEPVYKAVKLIVKKSLPKVTVKTLKKTDTLYMYSGTYDDGAGRIVLTCDTADIDDIRLMDTGRNSGGELAYNLAKLSTSASVKDRVELAVYRKGPGYAPGNNKGTLEVDLGGYTEPVRINYSVAHFTSRIKASVTKASVLTRNGKTISGGSISFDVWNVTCKRTEAFFEPKVTVKDKAGNLVSGYSVSYNIVKDEFTLGINAGRELPGKGEELYLYANDMLHIDELKIARIRIKGQDASKAALKLSSPAINAQFYEGENVINAGLSYYDGIGIKNCPGFNELIRDAIGNIEGVNDKSTAALRDGRLNITYDSDEGAVVVTYLGGNAPASGTYKYRITLDNAKTGFGRDISTVLTVKVKKLNKAKAMTGKASAKGKLFAVNRSATVLLIPKFNNLPTQYDITGVKISGTDAELFEIDDKGYDTVTGRLYLRLKKDVDISRYGKHRIDVDYTVRVGGGTLPVTAKNVKINIKQGTVKTAVSGNNSYNHNLRPQSELMTLAAYNSAGGSLSVNGVVLDGTNRDFSVTDNKDGTFYVNYSPKGNVKAGKTYTLKLKVSFVPGCPQYKMKYKVKIAK